MSGPGGVGKGTLVKRLVASDPRLWLSRSWTTRPPRPGEDETAYEFVDHETFVRKRDSGGLLEWAEFLGRLYGTPLPDPPPDADVLLEIDVQGAEQVRRVYPDAVVVLVLAPSREAQAERLRCRGDDDEHVARRLQVAELEERAGRLLADHVVVNDDVDRAVAELAEIVEAHRRASGRKLVK